MALPATPYYYGAFRTWDLSLNRPIGDAEVEWFAEGDETYSAPLTVWDTSGASLGTSVTSTAAGDVATYVLDVSRAVAKSGDWTSPVVSYAGLESAVTAARDAAVAAQAAAEVAAGAAVQTLPAGGTTGQALVKSSDANFDASWGDVATGGGGVPSAHASSHAAGGTDAVTVTIGQVTNLQDTLDAKAAATHTHTASQISDSTAAGRALLTAANAGAQRTALGVVEVKVLGPTEPVPGGTSDGAFIVRRTA